MSEGKRIKESARVSNYRRLAQVMDQRVNQLAREGVDGGELIHRMLGHLPDLQKIWEGASDEQLAKLCDEYPGFYRYASLMEEAAQAERENPSQKYQGLPQLKGALKTALEGLLTEAVALEQSYQSAVDGVNRSNLAELKRRRSNWESDRKKLMQQVKQEGLPKAVLDLMEPAFSELADRIEKLEKRATA